MLSSALSLLLLTLLCVSGTLSLSCLDEDGAPIDWFIGIKVPDYLPNNPQDGTQYFIMTSKSPQWKLSKCSIKGNCGAVYDTLMQIYNLPRNDNNSVSILYNDETPYDDFQWTEFGHMKGALAFKFNGNGFWMIHTVPKFPGYDSYNYPNTGLRYGQDFFCVTFPYSQISKIAYQLSIARPNTYAHNLPPRIAAAVPDFNSIVHKTMPRSDKNSSHLILTSVNGVSFVSFSKSAGFGADIYSKLLAPTLKNNFYMEGWVNGRGNLDSTCYDKYKIFRVTSVQLKNNWWDTDKDHSKWAVSGIDDNYNRPWVCLGDINREYSQFKRGGGLLCLQNLAAWKTFHTLVDDYEHCNDDLLFRLV